MQSMRPLAVLCVQLKHYQTLQILMDGHVSTYQCVFLTVNILSILLLSCHYEQMLTLVTSNRLAKIMGLLLNLKS